MRVAQATETAATPQQLAFFEQKIRPVLADNCYKCHSAQAKAHKKLKGGLYLDTQAGMLQGGETGPAIVGGNADKSLLMKAIRWTDPDLQMPKAKKLSNQVIADFSTWINGGAADPRTGVKQINAIEEATKTHWAYQPLAHPAVPKVAMNSWVRTPIDAFVLAKMESAGLKPAAPASRRVLIRRMTFDLTELPPTPEAVDAFVSDSSGMHDGEVVDQLLASSAFGECWARHWLDLARFAESHGFEQDYDRPYAFPYRDFVISAFNQDLPYTTFVSWQLAGDELAPNNAMALAATGFLAAGPWPTQITKNEVEKSRYDALDDMLSTTFTAMLGTTVGCARCHDHKYDPIKQRDYYRLLSTFTTTVRCEVDQAMDTPESIGQKAVFKAEQTLLETAVATYQQEQLPQKIEALGNALTASALWTTLPGTLVSAGGATVTTRDDGSFLLSGTNPEHDTYTITASTDLLGITGMRLEALSDPSMVKGGPGRAANGNFCLTDLRVFASPRSGGEAVMVHLTNARSTFDQTGLPITSAIDQDPTSGWAIDPQFGRNHAAAFTFEHPVGFPGGTRFCVVMHFDNNTSHSIGRPRLAVTTLNGGAPIDAGLIGPDISTILKTTPANRSREQQAALIAWYSPNDTQYRRLRALADAHLAKQPAATTSKMMISTEGLPAIHLHTQGGDFLDQTYFLKRGDPNQKVEPVTPSFWPVMMKDADSHWIEKPPSGWRTSYRRRSLANWMVDVDRGAGRLLARVIVNRLWQHLLGKGIAQTPSDIGLHGDPPTHPELLEWLTSDFVHEGWHLKPIIRSIVMSSVYRESAQVSGKSFAADPQDTLLTRFRSHRLEAEGIRDTLLDISGLLDRTMAGPGTLDFASRRRSIYFTIKRSQLIPMLCVFDFPDPLQGVAERPTTTIAPQALALMNNPQVRIWAGGFAARLTNIPSLEGKITEAYHIALGRPPLPDEQRDGLAFILAQTAAHGDANNPQNQLAALTDFAQVLLCLNETIYVE